MRIENLLWLNVSDRVTDAVGCLKRWIIFFDSDTSMRFAMTDILQETGLFCYYLARFGWVIFLHSEQSVDWKLQALRRSQYQKAHSVAMKIREIRKIIISSARNE